VQAILNHPAFQVGIAPFFAALVTVSVLQFVRLGGLAAAAGFATAAYLVSGFGFLPLNATNKIVLLGLAAPVIGLLVDFAFRPTRLGHAVLATAAGAAAVWTFMSVLQQKDLTQALLIGGGVGSFVAWLAGVSLFQSENSVRAGATGLGLGFGGSIACILGASAKFGSYGLALGAASGAFLLWQAATNRRVHAGATFTLSIALTAGLLLAGAMLLAQLPWYSLATFALVPLATLLPLPEKSHIAVQALVASVYAAAVAVGACALAWQSTGGTPG
jgi:hypothetical protein